MKARHQFLRRLSLQPPSLQEQSEDDQHHNRQGKVPHPLDHHFFNLIQVTLLRGVFLERPIVAQPVKKYPLFEKGKELSTANLLTYHIKTFAFVRSIKHVGETVGYSSIHS
jgi:hypothetical protein